MLSQTSLYAIRALAYLVDHRDEEPILSRTVGTAIDIPGNYLSKLMHALGTAGLLSAERGRGGGYRFAREPSAIRLIDVVELFQNTSQFSRCLLGRPQCSDANPCQIHNRWKPVSEALARFLHNTTVADLRSARQPAKPV